MDCQTNSTGMLDLLTVPAFSVTNNQITQLNQAASRLFLRVGLPIDTILEAGAKEYAHFSSGLLYVTLTICDTRWGATVTKLEDADIFVLDEQFGNESLRVLALAASELREPLANTLLALQHLRREGLNTSQLNYGLTQMQRIISNMSDASGISPVRSMEMRYIDSLFRECFAKVAVLAESQQIKLQYSGLSEDMLCLIDWQQLERAALNMISNAMKFTEPGGSIQAELHLTGKMLRFSVTDNGSGIPEQLRNTLFQRYKRSPAIEDHRHGIGLGLLLIRNAASSHGGAVLIDQPDKCGTRITITISTDRKPATMLRSASLFADYAGEADHALLELSDCLNADLY